MNIYTTTITAVVLATSMFAAPVKASSMDEFNLAICIYDKLNTESTYVSDLIGFILNDDMDGFSAKYDDSFEGMYSQFAASCVVELDTYIPNNSSAEMLNTLLERDVTKRVTNELKAKSK